MKRQLYFLVLTGLVFASPLAGCERARTSAAEKSAPGVTSSEQAAGQLAQGGEKKGAGDAYHGSAIAQHACIQCHDVGVPGLPSRSEVGAPPFVTIANGEGVTAEGLARWMRASHPAMPNFIFDEPSVSALSAYIMSLRTSR